MFKSKQRPAYRAVRRQGGVLFSQATLPLLLAGVKEQPEHPPTLIFTGATASVKANARVGAFATAKFALRALSSSLAKEFGPQGVHVGHAIIDGAINTPNVKEWIKDPAPDSLISPDGVCFI
jgi:NAD(P)-dependent dehydrogenase (short-subunit alcohol dehydrogenase family)